MKRQGSSINSQPSVKKSDDVSTDLRSKIGAKLQTLLNGISSDSDVLSRSDDYEDLLRESGDSEIIVDPIAVVVKPEVSANEVCNESQNCAPESILHQAKSRLTVLLNKAEEETDKISFKDCEKENSLSVSDCDCSERPKTCVMESLNASCKQKSCSSSLLNTKSKSHENQESDESNGDILISQRESLNMSVEQNNFTKSKNKSNSRKPTKHCTSFTPKDSAEERNAFVNTSNEISSVLSDCDFIDLTDSTDIPSAEPTTSIINISPSCSRKNSDVLDSKLHETANVTKSLKRSKLDFDVVNLGDMLMSETHDLETVPIVEVDEDSEVVDDPYNTKVSESHLSDDDDSDVILLCEKQPTYEVITLEDNEDDNINIVDDVSKCDQCGKTFRAKFLLNFHMRMHGSDAIKSQVSVSCMPSSINSDEK